jgi:hypothetical protein
MLPSLYRQVARKTARTRFSFTSIYVPTNERTRSKSTQPAVAYNDDNSSIKRGGIQEKVAFPSSSEEGEKTVLLNSREHAVGYLSKILNARVYDAAIETELQHAKSLSTVCISVLVFDYTSNCFVLILFSHFCEMQNAF